MRAACVLAVLPSLISTGLHAEGKWSGAYVGGSIGGGHSSASAKGLEHSVTESTSWGSVSSGGNFISNRNDYFGEIHNRHAGSGDGEFGAIAGPHIGAAAQVGRFVFGGEISLDWASLSNDVPIDSRFNSTERNVGSYSVNGGPYVDDYRSEHSSSNNFDSVARVSLDWKLSAVGRLGLVVSDQFLLYALAGWARGGFTTEGFPTYEFTARDGIVAGLGGEYAVGDNWFLKIEYRYTDFESFKSNKQERSYDENLGAMPVVGSISSFAHSDSKALDLDSHDIRLGVSYRFWSWSE